MNPTLYALCQKAIVGPALWITGQCEFPPPLPETPVTLAAPGQVLSQEFDVPVTKGYFLSLGVQFPSLEDRLSDRLIGAQYDVPCYGQGVKQLEDFPAEKRTDLGRPVRLEVKALNVKDGAAAWQADIASICIAGHDLKRKKLQVLALIPLAEGRYRLQVRNVEARPDLAGLDVSLTLHAGSGK
ncbi:hypothetical protein [Roseateles sp.]|uniref:hypothetical protein n=1 Tax=Roseateles sp. TaxID=1971397 RepID=UPI0032662CA8